MIPIEVVEPAVASIRRYLAGENYDKRSLKVARGVLDGLCPGSNKRGHFRITPAFRKNKPGLEEALIRACRLNGRPPPTDDGGVHNLTRSAIANLDLLVKSNGNEVERVRRQLRSTSRWTCDFLTHCGPTEVQQAAAD